MKRCEKRIIALGLAAVLAFMTGCNPAGNAGERKQDVETSTVQENKEAITEGENAASATADETEAVRKKEDTWDLTEYFADNAAFEKEIQEIYETEIPKYTELSENVTDVATLLAYEKYNDGLLVRIAKLANYANQKKDLDASDSVAISQYNAVIILEQALIPIETALTNRLISMDEAFWNEVFAEEALSPYWYSFIKIRENAAHVLTKEEELLLLPAGQAMGNIGSVFDALSYSSMQAPVITDPEGKEVTVDDNNYALAMQNPDREYRKRFYDAYTENVYQYRDTFAQNLNTYITLGEQLDKIYHYESSLDAAMQNAGLTEEIYEALLEGARKNADILVREREMRRKVLGYDTLYSYDLGLPIGNTIAPEISYEEAQQQIKEALKPLGDDYIATLDMAFKNRWIDVYPNSKKKGGAYSGGSISIHPWVLTNYTNDFLSVSTLAHELGHAVHQYRSYAAQESDYNRNPQALVSEVASTCNEQLLTRYMIEHASGKEEKLFYIQQELDMLKGTFFSQCRYADFEWQAHKLAEEGQALTADALDEIYKQVCDTYSPGCESEEKSNSHWAAVPHFYYNYYVYSYAMAVSVSCVVADAITKGDEVMLQNYQKFLAAGDSADAKDLFLLLGVDVTKPDYMQPLLERYSELLDMEEELLFQN